MPDKHQGKVIRFDTNKNFGFISSSVSKKDIFFHGDSYPSESTPRVGDQVAFRITEGNKGPRAVEIDLASRTVNPHAFFFMYGLGIYAVIFFGAIYFAALSLLLAHLLAINITCMAMMGLDKGFARANAFRVPAAVIFVLGAFGGSPGILVGAHLFRHKTRQAKFQLILFIILGTQVVLLAKFLQ